MHLYSSPNSPFGARVTIAARAKRLTIPPAALPEGGVRSEAYLAINPVAKLPVLVTDEGLVIPESMAILAYLEDRCPAPSLRPESAAERARVNRLVHIVDAYVMAPVIRLFPHLNPAARDAAIVAAEVTRWKEGLAALAHFMPAPMPEAEAGVTLADCALATALHLGTRIAGMLDLASDPIRAHPVLLDYVRRVRGHPLIGAVLADLTRAQHASDEKAGRPTVTHWHDALALAPADREVLQ